MENITTLTALKQQLDQATQNRQLTLRTGNSASKSLTQFLATLPTQQIALSHVSSTINDTAQTLTINGNANEEWVIRGTANEIFHLNHITLIYTQISGGFEANLTVEGTIKIGQADIPVIGLLGKNNQLQCQIKQSQSVHAIGLVETANFISHNRLATYLPTGVEVFVGQVPFTGLTFSFGFAHAVATRFSFTSDLNVSWKIVDQLASLERVGITLTAEHGFEAASGFRSSMGGNIHAYLLLEQEYAVSLALQGQYDWEIAIIPANGNILPGLATLAGLAGGKTLQNSVETGLRTLGLGAVAIDGVYLKVDLQAATLRAIKIQGHITIHQITFNIQAYLPNFEFHGQLSPNSPIHLKALINQYFIATDAFPAIDITALNIGAQPGIGQYRLYASIHSDWTLKIGDIPLVFQEFDLEITKQPGGVTGSIRGILELAEVELYASAEYLELGGGWEFYSGTESNQGIPIGELLNTLVQLFGPTTLPTAIVNSTIKRYYVSFNTQSKDFTFTCVGTVPLPEAKTEIEGTIVIEMKHQQDGSFTKLFGGTLLIDALEFALIFESAGLSTGNASTPQNTTTTFVAAYHDLKGREIAIDPLIDQIFQTSVTTGLRLSIKDALFAYQRQSSANYLFGIDIETGLNLSALQLPGLPLLGTALPPDQNLKLTLQVLYARHSFTAEAINTLNRLNRHGLRLPAKGIEKDVSLVALLRVGQEVKPLSLPIGIETNKNALKEDSSPSSASSNQSTATVTTSDTTQAGKIQQWVKIQKTFGPIQVERVGVTYQNGTIECLLDAALVAAGLTLSLDGLGAAFALRELTAKEFNPTFHLKGLGIDYRNGPLEIGGTFLQQELTRMEGGRSITEIGYAGLAVIRTEKLTLSAIGLYSTLNGHDPSLFIYAVLNYPLGGPAFFFVTGFAAGFGYNRALKVPSINEVAAFPLVQEAIKGDVPALPTPGGSQHALTNTLTTALQKLEDAIRPSTGDIFIAAGIKFTTFKHVNSFALLVVKFGQRFELDLLGLSTLVVPPPGSGSSQTIAQAQLALKATFAPEEGVLSIQAQLTANSYILSQSCQLTGGFAFFCWFKDHPSGARAGDFVITLGGYHAQFHRPAHYPVVPRLGFNWQVNKPGDFYELLIKGQGYFTLTAQALMAGGYLEATWSCGRFCAWFKAGVDFLINWKPYHYDAAFYIGIGASYTFEFFGTHTISGDLGADLHIWGPEFSGSATLHLAIISFTVSFGSGAPSAIDPIPWSDFKASFLPPADQICSIHVQQGLVRQIRDEKAQSYWIVNPKDFIVATNSVIPSTVARSSKTSGLLPHNAWKDLGIAPVGVESNVTTTQTITITDGSTDVSDRFEYVPILKSVPAGLWGKPNLTTDKNNKQHLLPPSVNGQRLLENTLAGFEIRPVQSNSALHHSLPLEAAKLQDATELVPDAFNWQRDFTLTGDRGKAAWDAVKRAPVVHQTRTDLLKALGWANPPVDVA